MTSKENNSSLSTKHLRAEGFRKLNDMTNFESMRQPPKITLKHQNYNIQLKTNGKLPDVKFINPKTKSLMPYPCYHERYLHFPKEMAIKLKKRHQDDDCETDDEIQEQSVTHNINQILKSLSQLNKKPYNTSEYLI